MDDFDPDTALRERLVCRAEVAIYDRLRAARGTVNRRELARTLAEALVAGMLAADEEAEFPREPWQS